MRMIAFVTAGVVLIACPMRPAGLLAAGPERPGPIVVPRKLRPPKGHEVLLEVEAEGVQVYVSKEVEGGKFAWTFKAPLADLSQGGKRAGYHYDGPSWEALDGSKVKGVGKAEVLSAPAPDPRADVPWLRIKVKPEGEAGGTLGRATYVLRLQTRGGVAPRQAPVRAGTEVGVRYRATYHFYGPAR